MRKGSLFIVATPIGNLKDITYRAVETLKSVDVILAEDTRTTKHLLKKYDIHPQRLLSYRDQIHSKVLSSITTALNSGLNIAIVSDAGTPTISDPGFKLIRDLRNSGFDIIPIPGVSAIITALSASGLPTDKFTFLGFLPKSEKKRSELLRTYGKTPVTLIIYESPYRINKLLHLILETLGDREIVLARELTKIHEEIKLDNVSNFLTSQNVETRGEYTILIKKSEKPSATTDVTHS
jgi:16S rRNA (cytidine1402-2'-O)-methyltransferase